MKKIKILLIALAILSINVFPVYASEATATANVTYYCEDYFFIEIPETIVVGEENYITVSEMNISPNKTIYVDLETNENNGVTIYNEYQDSETIDVMFVRSTGEDVSRTYPNIASFEYGSGDMSEAFNTYVPYSTGRLAGQYSGTATFRIHCE